ncbi:MAG: outer membrane protein transport protein [Candidatus Latescibacteria bacterium]|nr:outer membrane protein transport protein [Candidatus Latescibacterota bacterium]
MRALVGSLVLALGLSGVQAQEERAIDHFSGVGVRAMGMGGAFAGVADDFSALYWNPAGLAQLRQYEVYAGFLRNHFSNKSIQAGTRAEASLDNTRFGSLGLVVPYPVYQGSLVFAAGFNRIKDFDYALRILGSSGTDGLRTDNSFRHEGELAMTSVAGAVDVTPSVSVGAAFNFLSGEDQALNQFEWVDIENRVVEKRFVARDTFEDKYPTAFTATLGALFRSSREKPRVRVGATLGSGASHRVRYLFKGLPSATAYNLVEYDDGSARHNVELRDDGSWVQVTQDEVRGSYKISLPLEFGLGVSGQPMPGLLLAGSAHWAAWSQTEYQGEDKNERRAGAAFDTQYRDVVRYHLGAEWQVPVVALDLRAGFYTDPLPFVGPRDAQLSVGPENPLIVAKQDRRFYTLGAGLVFEEVMHADLAWVRGSYEQLEGPLAEKAVSDRVMVGVSCRF